MIIAQTKSSLSNDRIINWLRDLRGHAQCQQSHFAVACLLQCQLDNTYFTFAGVNIEDTQHNLLGHHAETSAISAMISLLGPNVRFQRAWVMGALKSTKRGSTMADKAISPCGRCRQALLSLACEEAQVFSVTLNGNIESLGAIHQLMPHSFSEQDLNVNSPLLSKQKPSVQHALFDRYYLNA